MKVFITGATGYLGYHIACQCLEEGHQVLCLRRSSSKSLFESEQESLIQWVTIKDNGWEKVVHEFAPDVLIHAAWGGVRGAGREDYTIQKQNICLSNLLFALYPYKQIIAIGSQAEYGYYEGPVSESHELRPIMKYALAKCASLHELQTYCEAKDIEWQWIRVFTVFGEKQTGGLISLAINNCKTGKETFDTTKGEQVYSYLYTKDFAKAICNVIGARGKSGVYNISQPLEEHSNKDILETIKTMMGSNIRNNYGAVPYAKDQIMLMSGTVDKFENAFGKIPHTDFHIALQNTINSL
jgi:nucleoside-diphosphate-sugar epimerase